jgi:alpha-glucuronidase
MKNRSGYELWMSYDTLSNQQKARAGEILRSILLVSADSDTCNVVISELERAGSLLTDIQEQVISTEFRKQQPACIIGTTDLLGVYYSEIFGENLNSFSDLGEEGYRIITRGGGVICVEAYKDRGLLYGTFALLRILQTGNNCENLNITEIPCLKYRMLNHWDNFDSSVERGYAGSSLWKWDELPGKLDRRYTDYARACASIGINCTVLNNVNDAQQVLKKEYLLKTAALAALFRNYGLKVFLSVNFASPMIIGGLDTADPLNNDVRRWWNDKVKEIYDIIPDFGGFLVKADSEGQPGPFSYNRSHAEGANLLADSLEPYGGLLIWRAFVYGHGEKDRAKSAYSTFKALDGQMNDNAVLQVKNGPIDFQPREPVHPLFGGLEKTSVFMEFQVTQEYLGQGNHIVYLAPMWKEILEFDTHAKGKGSTVASILENSSIPGIAGVANTGDDITWCGSHMHPANWYAFGRLAWNSSLKPEEIAREWISCTFGNSDDEVMETVLSIMMESWEACVDYMTPLCLHHIMKEGHHYGPDPGFNGGPREDWRSTYYHRADKKGLGFDRTRSGSGAVDQYYPEVAEKFNSLGECPEKYLLWFHHVPWDHTLLSGRTLKDELVFRYRRGVRKVESMMEEWKKLNGKIDDLRYNEILKKLEIQLEDAREWEDVCVSYFMGFT